MKASRPALFNGYLIENGKRRRARRDELREAWRLWAKHADIREGRVPIDATEGDLTKYQRAALAAEGGTR